MPRDLYDGFAERYDLFHGEFGEHDPIVVDFYRQLFDEHQVHRVLDCACGTGKDLVLFYNLGCQVVGSDASPSMLAQARVNLAECGVEVPLHQADYRALPQHFGQPFDAVACLSSSILHMPDEIQAIRAFQSMLQVLRDGGLLILTQGTTDKQWKAKPRFIPAINTHDFTRLFVIDYLGQGAQYTILDIYHSEERRDMEVWSVQYARILLRDDYERLLAASGFQSVDFYGSYRFQAYDKETSDRLIVVAQK